MIKASVKRSVKAIRIDRILHRGKWVVRTSIIGINGKSLYDEIYNDFDTAHDHAAPHLARPVFR